MICCMCGRAIERGAAVDYTGAQYHPRCIVRVLLADPAHAERTRRKLGRSPWQITNP